MTKLVDCAFKPEGLVLPLASILPLKSMRGSLRSTQKYHQVLASIREVGVIEPLVVFPQKDDTYLLLDGHVRLEALKQLGETHIHCLIATDDETYTYNKRVNRLATIQEHTMILKAIRSGVSEARIAKVLRVDIASIREKRDLLAGICEEAAEILKNRHVSVGVFRLLRKMKPMRQIEVAELLVATGNFSVPYTKALLAATQAEMLVEPDKHKGVKELTPEQIAKIEREMEGLQRDLKLVEENHGTNVLNLVLARGYVAKLFGNARVTKYLSQHHPDIFQQLQAVTQSDSLEN